MLEVCSSKYSPELTQLPTVSSHIRSKTPFLIADFNGGATWREPATDFE